MSQNKDTGFDSVTTSEAVTAFRSFTWSATSQTAGYTAAGGRSDGIIMQDAASGATHVPVANRSKPGTFKAMVAAACTVGDQLYCAASGKLSPTAVGAPQYVALETATADGDIIEVAPIQALDGRARTVEAHTADDTLTYAESGSVHTSVGASGTITLALPAAIVGIEFLFRVGAAQQLRIDPNGSEVIALPSSGVAGAAGKYLVADADGETVHLVCTKAGQWSVYGYTGTWTAEA